MKNKIDKIKKQFTKLEQKLQDISVTSNPEKLKKVSSEHAELKEAIDIINDEKTNVTILDVRTLDEYNTGYIKNAILIPVQELESKIDKLKKFKDNKIIVYCASGSRSISASRILYKKGYNPHNMNGGINNWKRNGYDIN